MPKIEYKSIKFQQKSLELINLVNQVVEEYQAQGYELTLRQAYYQLVARGYIPNNERSYKNIGNLINDGRLAGLIDWHSITDRTRNLRSNSHWDNPADVIASARYSYLLNKWDGQPNYVEVWVEKDALGLTVANIALGIGNAIAALASNMMTAFHNAICSVQSWFYNLLSTALSVIEGICSALNKLPFVEFDYSGISSAADDYAAKASEAAGNKEDYQSISDAFNEGFTTFDAFQDGWASDAFNAGAAWGDGIADKVSNFSLSDVFGQTDIPNVGDYTSGFNDAIANSGVGDSIGNIDDNTGKIKDSLEVSEEDLKYLRDIAEQEAINRFTTAEINVDMSGMQNTVNSGDDIDGFMTKLTDSVNEAVDNMTEGVHE